MNNNVNTTEPVSIEMSQMQPLLKQSAGLFQALSNSYRLQILMQLKQGEQDVHHLQQALNISQPLVSQHLKVLKTAGLLSESRQGRHIFYKLKSQKIQKVLLGLFQMQALELSPDLEMMSSLNELMSFWTL